uniref:Cadherin domain-containing protein n=1 Tax=Oncorhynchus tshawytscha TaxID=74940 RepID=A0AAZ3P966_ONCTS
LQGLVCSFAFFLQTLHTAFGDVSYSFPEEMKRTSVIGNIAKDLGLKASRLSARKARIDTEGNYERYCDINQSTGDLIVAERIDREGLCGKKASCVLKQELVLENPLEVQRISLHVQDINDNSPQFTEDFIKFEIGESTDKGARFSLDEAHDADIGQNMVQSYTLERNEYFVLNVNTKTGGRKYAELILDKELDREQQHELKLLLTAVDGGSPQRSGTVVIHVTVLDANDNAPSYKAHVTENNKLGSSLRSVTARDPDWRQNGTVIYSILPGEVNGVPVSSLLSVNGEARGDSRCEVV